MGASTGGSDLRARSRSNIRIRNLDISGFLNKPKTPKANFGQKNYRFVESKVKQFKQEEEAPKIAHP